MTSMRVVLIALLLFFLPHLCLQAQSASIPAWDEVKQLVDEGEWAAVFPKLAVLEEHYLAQKDWYHLAHVRTWLSDASFYLSKNRAAMRYAQGADQIVEQYLPTQIRDTLRFYPLLLENLGFFYSMQGDNDQQLKYYRKLYQLALRQPDVDRENVRNALHCMSLAFMIRMDWDSCIIMAEHGLEIAQRNEDKHGISQSMGVLANAYAELGQSSRAIDWQKEALRQVSDDMVRATLYQTLGETYLDLGETQQGIDALQKALLAADTLGPEAQSTIFSSFFSLARAYYETKDFDRCTAQVDSVIQRVRRSDSLNPGNLQKAYNYKASIEYQKGNFDQVIHFAERSLETAANNDLYDASALLFLSKGHLKQGRCEEALNEIQISLQKVVAGYQPQSAVENPALEQIDSKLYVLQLLEQKAKVQHCLGQKYGDQSLKDAINTYQLADSIIIAVRNTARDRDTKESLAAQAKATYEGALETLYLLHQRQNKKRWLEQAFEFSEKNRAMLVAESLNEINARNFTQIPSKLVNRERQLVKAIEFYAGQIREKKEVLDAEEISELEQKHFLKRRELEQLLDTFRVQYPTYFALKYNLNSIDIHQIKKDLLSNNEVLLEYFLGEQSTFLFIIGAESHHFIKLEVGTSDLKQEVLVFRDSLSQQAQGIDQLAFQLYNRLLGPYEQVIEHKNLVIVPDGVLGYLPFEVLLKRPLSKGKTGFRNSAYLFKDHLIRYIFSAQVALQYQARNAKEINNANGRILAMAPIFDKDVKLSGHYREANRDLILELEELSGSIRELEMLNARFQGDFFERKDARELVFHQKANNYQLLHLSTHAFFNDRFPSLSYLIFAPGDTMRADDDGLLYAYELYGMELKADLVVLSACNTGFGVIKEGEGIASLARAFAFAGSPNLVTSLWSVDDFSTARIMEIFYRNLDQGMSKSEALHQAKLTFLSTTNALYTHPYFWSGFIYTGDNEPVFLKTHSWWNVSYRWLATVLLLLLLAGLLYKRKSLLAYFT